jgi:hypothetical protein
VAVDKRTSSAGGGLAAAAERAAFIARSFENFRIRAKAGIDWASCLLDGVPVVTLVGQTVVGRAGLCQLSNLGLAELIAETPQQYVRVVAELAADLPRLEALRASLRQRMEQSPLMDSRRFVRGLEASYRQMWQRWCSCGL